MFFLARRVGCVSDRFAYSGARNRPCCPERDFFLVVSRADSGNVQHVLRRRADAFSIFALGIMPYISSPIILQLMTHASPQLEALKKEVAGRRKITNIPATVLCSRAFSGVGIAVAVEAQPGLVPPRSGFQVGDGGNAADRYDVLMWLGEQITERGLGNGISIIIFSGIAAVAEKAIAGLFELVRTGAMHPVSALFITFLVGLVTAFVVFVERGQRRFW